MEIEQRFRVYLDHNVLDSIIKGDRFGVMHLLEDVAFLPVYSDENLKEISKSKGHENEFIRLLESIKAWYLVAIADDAFIPTGNAQLSDAKPCESYASLMQTLAEAPKGDGGLSRLLQKGYGGLHDRSYREILAQGGDEVEELLRSACKEIALSGSLDPSQVELMRQLVEQVPTIRASSMHLLADQFEEHCPDSMVQTVQDGTGLSPRTLNNIKPPNIVWQVWKEVRRTMPNADCGLDTLFGLKQAQLCSERSRVPSIPEKVNAIYHQLNFLGYYRDTEMKGEKGLNRLFADMTHAGMASFCHLLLTGDKRMFMKATASYEYLNMGPQVHLLQDEGREVAGPWPA
jgi:hypothetical protein